MPIATLLVTKVNEDHPLTFSHRGRRWEQGDSHPVDHVQARYLEETGHFEIDLDRDYAAAQAAEAQDDGSPKGSDDTGSGEGEKGRPQGAALYDAIREAADDLDPDDETAFDGNGKPALAALNAKLGYEITAEELDRALASATAPANLTEAEVPAKTTGVKIRRVTKKEGDDTADGITV
jgi:hypothetical protein